ncbi:hypothetical protein HanPI659440_Chr06g0251091 [Helianthus annuus]|nr:hypothetical protein HanPI659440_Chr06g0251091 [Helianthus annuus]
MSTEFRFAAVFGEFEWRFEGFAVFGDDAKVCEEEGCGRMLKFVYSKAETIVAECLRESGSSGGGGGGVFPAR